LRRNTHWEITTREITKPSSLSEASCDVCYTETTSGLLRRVYDIDMPTCPNCGLGRLKPIATILDPNAIARILAAMDRFPCAPPG
jgi:hypothetical protein